MLDDAIRIAGSFEELKDVVAEIDAQLKPYKRQMDKATFSQTRENLLRKRLRDRIGIPRLSLFYL